MPLTALPSEAVPAHLHVFDLLLPFPVSLRRYTGLTSEIPNSSLMDSSASGRSGGSLSD
jgi:hypothetical protein